MAINLRAAERQRKKVNPFSHSVLKLFVHSAESTASTASSVHMDFFSLLFERKMLFFRKFEWTKVSEKMRRR